jgi:hypothetical protein
MKSTTTSPETPPTEPKIPVDGETRQRIIEHAKGELDNLHAQAKEANLRIAHNQEVILALQGAEQEVIAYTRNFGIDLPAEIEVMLKTAEPPAASA